MSSNYDDSDFPEPESYPGHERRDDCGCDVCKFERFVYVIDRLEAEKAQKDWEEEQGGQEHND